jgi:undecaprenyl phosphate N,N'-diacetylbacillosamine 1-phosphate transferase
MNLKKKTEAACKRLFDLFIAFFALLLTLPLWLLIPAAIVLDSGLPVFFIQERAGLNGKPFKVLKFRTMVQKAEDFPAGVYTHETDPRITRVGKWLRRLSLDELPQLLNVIKGDMSIVGPRPTLMYQIKKYNERQKKRLTVKPGITGWAQINGRNLLTWSERIRLDVWYVENCSLWLDFLIVLKTPIVVLKQEGIYRSQVEDPISGYRQKDISS